MDGCGSCLNDLTIFISFHLDERARESRGAVKNVETYNERTLAAVVEVFER